MTDIENVFCGCDVHDEHAPLLLTTGKVQGRIFRYQMVYRDYPAFAFAGFNNKQTVAMIRKAMANMSNISGAKFVEVNKNPQIRFYFMKNIYRNAIAAYMGSGKVYLSQVRKVTEVVVNASVQHEVGHYFGIKGRPAADGWGHCGVKTCIMNINGNGTSWCANCKGQMIAKYGK
jgi:hypothetical protein